MDMGDKKICDVCAVELDGDHYKNQHIHICLDCYEAFLVMPKDEFWSD